MNRPALERRLGLTDAVTIGLGAMLGAGVFAVLAPAARVAEIPVRGVELTRSLRAVWRRARRPTGPAQDLLAIARRVARTS